MKLTATTRIILADDDEDELRLFEECLEDHQDVSILFASDGVHLMQQLALPDNAFDYIFIDLTMPLKDGVDCLREIRANDAFNHVPVFIYSMSASPKKVEQMYAMGATLFIEKPDSVKKLKTILEKVLAFDWKGKDAFDRTSLALLTTILMTQV